MSDDDPKLRAALHALRDHDAHAAPSFQRVHARAEGALRERRRRRVVAFAGLAAAAVILLFMARPFEPSPPAPWPEVRFAGTEPLAFLSEAPSASVVRSSSLRRIEGSW